MEVKVKTELIKPEGQIKIEEENYEIEKLLSMEEAKNIILSEIENLKKGNFSDELVEAIRNNVKLGREQAKDSNAYLVERFRNIFINGKTIDSMITAENQFDSLTKEDVVKNFLSYFIGCAMGRYSLDYEGLIFAGGDFDENQYSIFSADKDAIIPVTDEQYFDDDIVGRFETFVKTVFGSETLEANLDFIADALEAKGGSSREKIRNYFLNDFFMFSCHVFNCVISYFFNIMCSLIHKFFFCLFIYNFVFAHNINNIKSMRHRFNTCCINFVHLLNIF